MINKSTEERLDLAVENFMKTFQEFETAAKELMKILKFMNQKRYQESKALSEKREGTYKFLIQTLHDGGRIEEKAFDVEFEGDNKGLGNAPLT